MIIHHFDHTYDNPSGPVPWRFNIIFSPSGRSVLVQGIDPLGPKSNFAAYGETCQIEGGEIQWVDIKFRPLHKRLFPQELRDHVVKLLKMKVFW